MKDISRKNHAEALRERSKEKIPSLEKFLSKMTGRMRWALPNLRKILVRLAIKIYRYVHVYCAFHLGDYKESITVKTFVDTDQLMYLMATHCFFVQDTEEAIPMSLARFLNCSTVTCSQKPESV
jgi:hypothetical protein